MSVSNQHNKVRFSWAVDFVKGGAKVGHVDGSAG